MQPYRARGFTLVELMITVGIVAILAAVALPSYRDYQRRGLLPEAFTFLSDYRIKLEQYYQDHRNFGVGDACANQAAGDWKTFRSGAQHYFTFACRLDGGDGQAYTLTATGASGPAVGHVYTLDSANQPKTLQFKGQTVDRACWLSKGSEC